MLTTKVITPKQGESYYAKENYYSAEECVEHSQWFGEGARVLGLRGKVKPKQFKRLLYGELPNGTKFRTQKQPRQGYKERAGLDCTFSAPKSVSILALVEGNEKVEKAHKKAIKRTLKIIERDYALTRIKKNGQARTVNTNNLVIGQFHHDTSRELDPHLHTHCVILNMTHHNDKWYAFRNDAVHANKKMLGMIYQNELAIEIQKLGYEIEPKSHGQFEIKGFKDTDLQSLSKRRQQIQAQLRQGSTWKDREKVWDKTRIKKGEPIAREELQNYWRQELSDAPVPQPVPEQAKEYNKQLRTAVTSAKRAVTEAIEHCSERNVAFKPEALKKFILEDVGKYSHESLHNEIINNNELIYLDRLVTTQTALLREINTIRLVKDGQEQVDPLSTSEAVTDSLAGLSLTEGQKNAVIMAATTSDQIIAWSGKAGVGKTYALNTFKTIAQNAGYTIKGFAPSAKAAGILSEEMDINATTVARKLVSKSLKEEAEQQQIWIVDEAGLLGAKDAHELLQKAKAENARVLLVGDTRQLSSVAAGNPFKSLQQAGMATAFMNQSRRQKTKDLKQAVNLLSDGKAEEGIKILDANKRIEEIPDEQERSNRIASDYLNLTPEQRKQTLIIAGTHKERQNILDTIRTGLKAEGSLGKSVLVKRLKSKNLSTIQKKYAHNYDVGNVVIPLSQYKRLGLEKNERYLVKAVEKKTDSLVLIDKTGTEKRLSPAHFKYKEVYEVIDTDIAEGDRLRWGKNDKELNRTNGEEFTVRSINDDGTATITTETGHREQINLKKLQHLDHALVSTTYSSQGSTSNKVLVSVTNDLTLSQESFYVAASRAKYNLQFYVEDKASLIENASKSRAQKNPLELIREHQREAVAVETVATAEPESKPEPSPQKPKPILRNKQEVSEPELEITSSPQQEEVNEEEADITIPISPEETTQPQPLAVPAPRHYTDVRDSIREKLSGSSISYSEQLQLRASLLTQQIEQLEHSEMSKRKQKNKEYFERQLRDIEAFTQLKEGQQVTLKEIKGTITDLQLSPGGMPVVWVHWDNSTVPIPEQPSRLTVLSNNITKEIQHDTDSQQPESNLGRYINRSLETSSLETRPDRGQIDPRRVLSSSPETTRSINRTNPTVKPSNRASGTEVSTISGETTEFVNPTSPTVDQPNRTDGTEISTISPVIEPNLDRVSKSRSKLERSRDGLGQHRQQLERRNQQLGQGNQELEQHQGKHQQHNRQLNRTNGQFQHSNQELERIKQEFRDLANELRQKDLYEVIELLGLQQDRYDQNKYRSNSQIITIDKNNPHRYYDHLNLVGGGGAIDLVMHVQGSKFKDAVQWLNGSTINLTPSISQQPTQSRVTKPEVKKEPFTPPVIDESKWSAVKDYLVNTRGIDETIIDHLHQRGSVYADNKQNAVFLRKDPDGNVTGASLRGTYNDSKFKGLAKGTERDAGWFAHTGGKNQKIERIILTESPIDALSAATLSQKPETTLYLSIDGSGAIPEDYLKEKLQQGKEVIIGFDNDEAGNSMSQQILNKLPGSVRVTPKIGKDWNERLLLSKNPIEEQKWLLRQEYKQLSQQVRSLPGLADAPVEEVDMAVAMLVIKNELAHNSTEHSSGKVFKVLSQSDLVLDWKQSLPDLEYRALTKQYVVDTFNAANSAREAILEQRQQHKQQPNQGFDLEM